MNENAITHMQFIGGPFDGYEQPICGGLTELAGKVALPINENIFLMLDGKDRGPVTPATITALYELRICHELNRVRCFFIGTRRSKDLGLSWSV